MVRRPFPSQGLEHFDPLLLLDEMGPTVYGPGEAVGAPDHPHRGFETVTYILDGEGEHADSAGHAGTIGPGDVQWMTAGAGVVHREMPSARIQRDGGRVHGFQLWVNLPKAAKLSPPRYQELKADAIPEVRRDGVRVRVIAGEALGEAAAVRTHTAITYLHAVLEPGAEVELAVPASHRVGVYVFEGSVVVGGEPVADGRFARLGDGDRLTLRSSGGGQCLVLGGEPLDEPIAWHGPFVMNTREELVQAVRDYQAGRLGRIPPEIVKA